MRQALADTVAGRRSIAQHRTSEGRGTAGAEGRRTARSGAAEYPHFDKHIIGAATHRQGMRDKRASLRGGTRGWNRGARCRHTTGRRSSPYRKDAVKTVRLADVDDVARVEEDATTDRLAVDLRAFTNFRVRTRLYHPLRINRACSRDTRLSSSTATSHLWSLPCSVRSSP